MQWLISPRNQTIAQNNGWNEQVRWVSIITPGVESSISHCMRPADNWTLWRCPTITEAKPFITSQTPQRRWTISLTSYMKLFHTSFFFQREQRLEPRIRVKLCRIQLLWCEVVFLTIFILSHIWYYNQTRLWRTLRDHQYLFVITVTTW